VSGSPAFSCQSRTTLSPASAALDRYANGDIWFFYPGTLT
jgi:hypothetical protein